MSRTPDVISQEIIAKLNVTAPGFSLELGTPERKMVDAVAESISECYIDQYLVGSLMDIESKSGIELEQWVGTFGFGRLQGRKATGVVRVELENANPEDISLGVGTQFYTRQGLPGTINPLYFSSTMAIVIPTGSYVADVPVECTIVGTGGNVPPDSIVYLGSILGATSVTNLIAMTGGVDIETDDELRQRFKDTFMRNIAGTADWYLGLAYQNTSVSKAVVFGPVTKYATQITVPSPGAIYNFPDVPLDVKYAWENGETVFQNLGQLPDELGEGGEVFYRPIDDYNFIYGQTPGILVVEGSSLADQVGQVVDVEFEYVTQSSRNVPDGSNTEITNKVDLFVNGADPCPVTERTVVSDSSRFDNVDPESIYYYQKFVRVKTGEYPLPANRFMRLGSVPVFSFPDTVIVNEVVYQEEVDYHLVRGTTLEAGSIREVSGIEWELSGPPDDITPITLNYVYNRVPEVLGAVVKQGKQITTDVLVHQAAYSYLKIYLSIEYDRSYVVAQVNNSIETRLRGFFGGMPYGMWVEFSDICLVVHQVLGVDNVSITTKSEAERAGTPDDYGVKTFTDSTAIDTGEDPYTLDFKLRDNMLPIYLSAKMLRKPNR